MESTNGKSLFREWVINQGTSTAAATAAKMMAKLPGFWPNISNDHHHSTDVPRLLETKQAANDGPEKSLD